METTLDHLKALSARYATSQPDGLVARKGDTDATLYLYSEVTPEGMGGVSAKAVVKALAEAKGAKALNVRINSIGGVISEAKAIYVALQEFPGKVVAHVDGLCASAATFIAMAADEILSAPEAVWMIHEAQGLAAGHADNLRAMADILDRENANIANIYARRTGKDPADMRKMMAAMNGSIQGTFFTAQEARDIGFTQIDGEVPQPKAPRIKNAAEIAIQLEVAKRNAKLRRK